MHRSQTAVFALAIGLVVMAGCSSDSGGTVTEADFTEWLQNTDMVGPYDQDTAECIAASMYAGGLTSDEAQQFLDEGDEPDALDLYTDAALDCDTL